MASQLRTTTQLKAILLSLMLSACGDVSLDLSDLDSGTETPVPSPEPTPTPITGEVFSNPLYSNGADPWLQWYQGNYYLTTTTWTSQLVMRKSPTIEGFKTATPHYIWSDTVVSRAYNFWAFEFHRLQGPNGFRWYLMYTSGHQENLDGQRLHVLESAGDDPLGPYEFKSTLMPNRWNIDGSYFTVNDQLYVVWSEWVGADQSTWIAKMDNPWTVDESTAVVITKPELDWEFGEDLSGNIGRVTEGQAILKHDGRIFMSYSTNPCHGPNYKLGLLELVGTNPLEPSAWQKNPTPMFTATETVFGPGHNGFFQSPDGSEDWLVYHGNPTAQDGCGNTRSVRVQPISYDETGFPNFGTPADPGEEIQVPSGESGPLVTQVEGMSYRIAIDDKCLVAKDDNSLTVESCSHASDTWVVDYTRDGKYRLAHNPSGKFLADAQCTSASLSNSTSPLPAASTPALEPWTALGCAEWQLSQDDNGLVSISKDANSKLNLNQCDTTPDQVNYTDQSNKCSNWSLQPAGEFAITNLNTGKVLQTASCSDVPGSSIVQWQWNRTDCQRASAKHVEDGWFEIMPTHMQNTCLQLSGQVTEPGADVIAGTCGSNQSHWRFDPLSDGTYRLVSRASGHVLDLDFCLLADGTNFGQWEWLDNYCQRFTLKPTDGVPTADSTTSFLYPVGGNLGTHDPTLEIENDIWYEFQTGTGIQSKQSNNGGLSWSGTGAVLPNALAWWADYVPEHANNDVWAPDVEIYNGKVWMYYSISTFGSNISAIGLLSADSLANANWQDEGHVISTDGSQNFNAIDPNLFIDTDNEPWLVFGSWWSGIKLTKLDKTTMKPTGSLTSLATRGGGLEGPSLMYRDGYYYLFVSVGKCCDGTNSTYQIRYGRSTSITGPYLDKSGTDMLNAGGSLLWSGDARWIGPGGQDIYQGSVINFHAYDAFDNGAPKLNLADLKWDSDNWPYLTE
ncbi:family 43 glycosylhydrolase [Catenovulum sp. SX2]|uniref:family 43 glycosylhydrolase n=1 Tax=Catenovulum sp. SX2 TaxID=3398614 RepID=UPI003F844D8B